MSSTSKIDIWNMALGFIGTRTVVSDNELNNEVKQCNLFWDNARRQVLRDFPYSFAQKRLNLPSVEMPKEYAMDWIYAYGLPINLLKAQSVWGAAENDHKSPFTIITIDKGVEILLTNQTPCILTYTVDTQENTNFYDDSFIELLSYKLASLIAVPLLKNTGNKVSELHQLYDKSLAQATKNSSSSKKEQPIEDEWIMSRCGLDIDIKGYGEY